MPIKCVITPEQQQIWFILQFHKYYSTESKLDLSSLQSIDKDFFFIMQFYVIRRILIHLFHTVRFG